jgi:hypothetical protein
LLVASVHADLGTTLEIAQKYTDAKKEYQNGLDMLRRCQQMSNGSQNEHPTDEPGSEV